MSERSAGYVTDVGYTFGYHAALNPLSTRLAFLRAGLEPPRITTACELGFGQGVSLAVHAAASTASWWGTDLNPEHVRFAQSLDTASGAGSVLVEATFKEFAERTTDLPQFDFIGLHGVLSWISADNRACIADFLHDRLAPGGVVYAGYNALPGWADMVPLRRLMAGHTALAGSGGTAERIDAAIAFTARLLDTHPLAVRGTPGLAGRFERLRHADRPYLAHEYFNRDWEPLYFADVAALLGTAGLRHACPAQLRDHLDALNLTDGQRRLLGEIADPGFRETVRDFMTNAQVRRDYWVRDARPMSADALREAWRDDARRARGAARGRCRAGDRPPWRAAPGRSRAFRGTGCARRSPASRDPRRAGRHGPRGRRVLADAVFQLAAFGYVSIAQDDATIGRCRPRTERLNARLVAHAATSDDITVLASPVIGGGVNVEWIEQLFIAAIETGCHTPEEWAAHAQKYATPWNEVELATRARDFAGRRLPVLRALGVAPDARLIRGRGGRRSYRRRRRRSGGLKSGQPAARQVPSARSIRSAGGSENGARVEAPGRVDHQLAAELPPLAVRNHGVIHAGREAADDLRVPRRVEVGAHDPVQVGAVADVDVLIHQRDALERGAFGPAAGRPPCVAGARGPHADDDVRRPAAEHQVDPAVAAPCSRRGRGAAACGSGPRWTGSAGSCSRTAASGWRARRRLHRAGG